VKIDPDAPILDLELLEAVRAQALRAVMRPDAEALLRRIYRGMAEKYHIPLDRVDQLPLLWLLQHYYEGVFENMSEEDRIEAAEELAETPEERRAREIQESEEEDAFIAKQLQKEMEREAKRGKTKRKSKHPPPKLPEISMAFPDDLDLDGPSIPDPPPRNLRG
jgi:hypothetical protein